MSTVSYVRIYPMKDIIPKDYKLTLKQRKFFNEWFSNGGNGTQAALKAYDTDYMTAAMIASENLKKHKSVIYGLLDKQGLTIGKIVKTVKEATEAEKWNEFTGQREADHGTRLKAVTVASRLHGLEEQSQTNVQVNVMNAVKSNNDKYGD